jgi:hypothetical protein
MQMQRLLSAPERASHLHASSPDRHPAPVQKQIGRRPVIVPPTRRAAILRTTSDPVPRPKTMRRRPAIISVTSLLSVEHGAPAPSAIASIKWLAFRRQPTG